MAVAWGRGQQCPCTPPRQAVCCDRRSQGLSSCILTKALGRRDRYSHSTDEKAEGQSSAGTCPRTQNDPSFATFCLQLRLGEGLCQGFRTGSCCRRARGKGHRIQGQLAPVPAADPLSGASGADSSGQPCLTDRVKDGEVLLTKALIFLSLLYAFY